ncbi:exosortase Q [Variovorax sp. YR752]|uniref:exosortase Q n=1 Tax=Variovorax sp. YR752 TaxID=1884383 RepID=UPI003137C126
MGASLLPRAPAAGPATLACRPSYLSPVAWLALQAAALWPHGAWMARRVQDGSDDPLGLAAIAALLMLVAMRANTLRIAPQTGWLAAGAGLGVAANAALWVAPPLACALLAALSLAAALMAWLPASGPRLPLAGLVLLALPWIASLQYYGGYPLRVLTAQLSAWGLQGVGIAAERSGTAMLVRGQLVIVDAPCSGVQMAWMAWFCACAVAALVALRDGAFLRRLPAVGAIVLIGNVLRNTVLVALESRPLGLAGALHEGIGLLALALVCSAVIALMTRRSHVDLV